ncbi:EFR1 family ferrodoxin [Ruminococcus gauvreauii]|uniref:EFR1 family ferrodoxin n=1 Tax=Ruminococcus gauvreauii TaxID=438033 RepID=UPI003984535C
MTENVWAMYFSATDTTKTTVCRIADKLAEELSCGRRTCDFTRPAKREEAYVFTERDLVVFGTPVYAGRVPNVLLPFLKTVRGNGAMAVPVVLYGNRNFDDALAELRDLLTGDGFVCTAAAAFVGEHAFSDVLAKGRPDEEDLAFADQFALRLADKIRRGTAGKRIEVPGESPQSEYFKPKGPDGRSIDIRRVRSLVNENCDNCGVCAKVCPMGSISTEDVREYTGICIKCGACIKKCPQKARYYTDRDFLFHKEDLEKRLTGRGECGVWL